MRRKRRHIHETEEGGNASWLTTFNDMMTLLMVFFVLIFSMGSLDLNRTSGLIDNLQSALGVLMAGKRVPVAVADKSYPPDNTTDTDAARSSATQQNPATVSGSAAGTARLQQFLKSLQLDPSMQARFSGEGLHITLKDNILFDTGRAEINPRAFPLLDRMAVKLAKLPNSIRIEGHTDNVPIKTELYPSNWELSVARAVNVLKYLVKAGGIAPSRMSAVGYGNSRPLMPNDSLRHRAQNRRVEFVLVAEGK